MDSPPPVCRKSRMGRPWWVFLVVSCLAVAVGEVGLEGVSRPVAPPPVLEGGGVHLVLTRYNIGQTSSPVLSETRRQQFESISKASLEGQSDRRFFWLLTTDPEAVGPLERERARRAGDHGWYRFVAVDGVEHHLDFVPLVYLDFVFGGNWSRFATERGISHLVTTHLDVDDGLPRTYFETLSNWYAREAEANRDGFIGACADREVDWVPDATEPRGLTLLQPNLSWENGCLASGLTIARPLKSSLHEDLCPICHRHTHIRVSWTDDEVSTGPIELLDDHKIFRVRSVSSAGAFNIRLDLDTKPDDTRFTPADPAFLKNTYNIDTISTLNDYLVQQSEAIATEMLHNSDAAGCNPAFAASDDSCGRAKLTSAAFLENLRNMSAAPPKN